jgi:hypothetical protein
MNAAINAAKVSFKAICTSYHNGYMGLKPFQKNELSMPQNRKSAITQKATTNVLYIFSMKNITRNTEHKIAIETIESTTKIAVNPSIFKCLTVNTDTEGAKKKSNKKRTSNQHSVAIAVHK